MSGRVFDDVAAEQTAKRKDSHLDLCASDEVAPPQNSTLFEHVQLVHCAMPELSVASINLELEWLGKRLKAPVLMTGMTGGTPRAAEVNRQLATVAEELGIAFGVGSQRAMAEQPELARTYAVRDVAPTVALIGNLGVVQAAKMGASGVRRLMDAIEADAIAVHLNPGQELIQPEGDRDFRGGYTVVAELAKALGPRLVVKETGCGLSPEVVRRLVECGVQSLDVSGLGGTSWVRVEQLRAAGEAATLGAQLSGWGIPTAAALMAARAVAPSSVRLVASGGMRTGLEAAKALTLGADVVGMALPFFKAQQAGGVAAVRTAVGLVLAGLTKVMALTGSGSLQALRKKPRVIGAPLREWVSGLTAVPE